MPLRMGWHERLRSNLGADGQGPLFIGGLA